ncbi:MAG: hypothetical protein WC216_06735 [Gallionella sp.]|jgi:hypothetical protein
MSRDETQLLARSVSACKERIASLQYSVAKNAPVFPLSLDSLKNISEDQKESIDAMILRYSQCVSMIQDQLFKGIAIAEQEDINDKSNRDKSLLMEKLGAIKSAADFGVAAVLRNKFAHHYPEESRDQIDKLNSLIREAAFVSGVFDSITAYIENKRLLSRDDQDSGG